MQLATGRRGMSHPGPQERQAGTPEGHVPRDNQLLQTGMIGSAFAPFWVLGSPDSPEL